MIREFLRNCPYVDLAVAGQLIFFCLFLAALVWVFRNGSKDFYDKLSQLPLEEKGHPHE